MYTHFSLLIDDDYSTLIAKVNVLCQMVENIILHKAIAMKLDTLYFYSIPSSYKM